MPPQSQASETVTLRLPSGEDVDAIVPPGMSDQQVHDLMQQKHPEYFQKPTQQSTDIAGKPRSAISRFWEGAKAGTGGVDQMPPIDPNRDYLRHPNFANNPMLPGSGVYRDIKSGNYAGAVGRIAGPAVELGTMLVGGRGVPEAPSSASSLLREAVQPPISGNAKLDLLPTYPGAHLPEKPSIELMQARSLIKGGQPAPEPISSGLGKIPNRAEAPIISQARPIARGAQQSPSPPSSALGRLPVANQESPLIAQASPLSRGGRPTPPAPSASLGRIPAPKAIAEVPTPDISRQNISNLLDKSLGAKPLEPNVPIGQQRNRITSEQVPSPQGHKPVESSAIKSYKYDPTKREFEVVTQNGSTYIHGDVSPEQAQTFEAAPSKGKAWSDLKANSTYVGKIVNGKRVAAQPPTSIRSADPNDLTGILEKSVAQAKANKRSISQ